MQIVKINEEVEVNKTQFNHLKVQFSGIVAHREENGKYFIVVMIPGYSKIVQTYLEQTTA